MEIKSNLDKVIRELQERISVKAINELTKEVAETIYQNSVKRIFNNGRALDGSKIGNYRKSTKIARRKRGLQTSYVDLTFTGTFRRLYKLRKLGFAGYVIGFPPGNLYGEYIISHNERRFGKKIFGLTKNDQKIAKGLVDKFIISANKSKGLK